MFLRTDTSDNAHYSNVPRITHARNSFSVAETLKTTINFDYLYPIYHKFIYPGDTISIEHMMMARLQTQISDLFDDLYFDLHAWYVPFRLIQTNWSRFQFNTQTTPGQDNTGLTTPAIDLGALPLNGAGNRTFVPLSLYDYFGYPVEPALNAYTSTEHINNYLARAYQFIWNTNYRDENLQSPLIVDLGDGPDNPTNYQLRTRGKRHDMFTSALPFAQKGFLSTGVQITGSAPIQRNPNATAWTVYQQGNNTPLAGTALASTTVGGNLGSDIAGTFKASMDPNGGLTANLTSGFAYMMINDLRLSASVQQLFEADARGGTRDVESILHRWGVQVPDFRLQRPEYLGGATFTFDGHVVPSTVGTDDNPQAHLTAFSQAMNSFKVTHSFQEHGVFMILVSCRSNMTYQEGLEKQLSYKTRFDFYQPEFANLGEVGIKGKEISMTATSTANNAIFGYQEYGYELRYGMNRVTGEMRSSYVNSLDYKHMAYDFNALPVTLNAGFISSQTPIDRNIVVDSGTSQCIQINQMVKGTMARTLPMYSVPGITRV